MKVALLHDWVTCFRGGERILEVFAELFPEATLYTLIHKPGSSSPVIENRCIVTSFLNHIPGIHDQYRKFLPLFPLAASSMKIDDDVDLVLSSSHCVIKGVAKPKGAKHLSYIHSPMRYIYDQFDVYFGAEAPLYQQWGGRLFRGYLTRYDQESNHNVDRMLANSHFVQERIRRFYGREAGVLFPFVEARDFINLQAVAKEDFYLMVTAFAPNKRVDLAIHAFNQLQKKLVIIGSGQQEKWLKAQAGPSIEFLGNLPRSQVIDYLARARALVFPGVEDFGITPLESLAAGTPVIAFKAGGVLDTLTNQVAQFFLEATVEALVEAVQDIDKRRFDPSVLKSQAEKFSRERFIKELSIEIEQLMGVHSTIAPP